jgi:hypothetical protein
MYSCSLQIKWDSKKKKRLGEEYIRNKDKRGK